MNLKFSDLVYILILPQNILLTKYQEKYNGKTEHFHFSVDIGAISWRYRGDQRGGQQPLGQPVSFCWVQFLSFICNKIQQNLIKSDGIIHIGTVSCFLYYKK